MFKVQDGPKIQQEKIAKNLYLGLFWPQRPLLGAL